MSGTSERTEELRLLWPWSPPGGWSTRTARPSPDPEAAAFERAHGLTASVARRWAALVPEILGPLRHDPLVQPLSLAGGHLRAVALERLPAGGVVGGAWEDVELVVTNDVEVCEALADGRRRFVVGSEACVDAVARRSARELVELVHPWRGPSGLPFEPLSAGFLPLVRFGPGVWLCWDRDEERPNVVLEGYGRFSTGASGHDRLGFDFGPTGPVPFARHKPPTAPQSHLAAGGQGWSAAVGPSERGGAQVVSGPDRRWALVSTLNRRDQNFCDHFAWHWIHRPASVWQVPARAGWQGEVVVVELEATSTGAQRARVTWAGGLRTFVLRGGALVEIAPPHTIPRGMGLRDDEVPLEHRYVVTNFMGPPRPPKPANLLAEARETGPSQTPFPKGPETIEVDLLPGDRIVVCTSGIHPQFPLDELARLASGDVRRAANEIELRLRHGYGCDVALLIDATATSAVEGPWFVPFSATLLTKELPAKAAPRQHDLLANVPEDPYPAPGTWGLYRRDPRDGAMAGAESFVFFQASWSAAHFEAVERAAATLDVVPETGDFLSVRFDKTPPTILRFDGVAWRREAPRHCRPETRVTGGVVELVEDRPSERLARAWTDARERANPQYSDVVVAVSSEALARVADEEGFVALGHYLRLLREHRQGFVVAGLMEASERVSYAVRQALFDLDRAPPDATPHEVDVEILQRHPELFHLCRVRYRSVLSEVFENMSTAGGWWEPLDAPTDDRVWAAEVVATWMANPRGGYGNYAFQRTSAVGRATAIPLPPVPRWVGPEALHNVRRGVPVRTVLDVRCVGSSWTWRGQDLLPPTGEPTPSGAYRMEVVLLRAERFAVLKVLRREPIYAG